MTNLKPCNLSSRSCLFGILPPLVNLLHEPQQIEVDLSSMQPESMTTAI